MAQVWRRKYIQLQMIFIHSECINFVLDIYTRYTPCTGREWKRRALCLRWPYISRQYKMTT